MSQFSLPPAVAAPIAAHEALGREVEAASAVLVEERRRARRPPWLAIMIGAGLLSAAAVGVAAPVGFALRAQASADAGRQISTGLLVIAYGGLVIGLAAGIVLGMRNARLRLALTPFVNVRATDEFSLSCPSCGAHLTIGGTDVVTRCGHCGTASLLPAALLPRQLQTKHARLVALRRRAADAGLAIVSVSATINESIGWALIAIGALGAVWFVAITNGDFAPHLTDMERLMLPLCSGGMWLSVFGGSGVMSIRYARKERRGRP